MLFSVVIVACAYIDTATTVLDEAIDGLFIIGGHFPILGKVVANTVGNDADGYLFFVLGF